MTKSDWVRRVVPGVVGLAAVAVARVMLDRKRTLAELTVGQIEDAITALDPVTRAAVLTRLGVDVVDQVKARIHDGNQGAGK